jgi:hypothetical protein
MVWVCPSMVTVSVESLWDSYETGALNSVSSMIFPGRAREGGC